MNIYPQMMNTCSSRTLSRSKQSTNNVPSNQVALGIAGDPVCPFLGRKLGSGLALLSILGAYAGECYYMYAQNANEEAKVKATIQEAKKEALKIDSKRAKDILVEEQVQGKTVNWIDVVKSMKDSVRIERNAFNRGVKSVSKVK